MRGSHRFFFSRERQGDGASGVHCFCEVEEGFTGREVAQDGLSSVRRIDAVFSDLPWTSTGSSPHGRDRVSRTIGR